MSDRKYSQKGYREEERERPSRRTPGGRPASDGPRGRGLGAPTHQAFRCAVCGAQQPSVAVATDTRCGSCGADVHSCTHCLHFEPAAHFECRLPIDAPIRSKSKRNECVRFEARVAREHSGDKAEPNDPRAAFDALFKP